MEIHFWETDRGDCEVAGTIQNLDKMTQKKVTRDLEIFERYNLQHCLRIQLVKPIHKTFPKIYEIVIRQLRLLFHIKENQCWIVDAFVKKTRKTPPQNIEKAINRAKRLY